MTRLLFVPDPNTLIWLDLTSDPAALVADIQLGVWLPPAPYTNLAGQLKVYWQEGLVIVSTLILFGQDETRPRPILSRRQREILKGLMDGLTSRQMALRLGLRERMVFHHIAALKRLLGAGTRAELVVKGRDLL
jgi:DNA-binding CsgD family transcriptional regulator